MTVHSVDEYGHSDKIIGMKYKDRKLSKKNLIVSLLELILTKKVLVP